MIRGLFVRIVQNKCTWRNKQGWTLHGTPFYCVYPMYGYPMKRFSTDLIRNEQQTKSRTKSLELQLESSIQSEDYENSLRIVNELIDLEPNNPEWYMDLSTIYQKLDRIEDSIQAMQKSFEVAPRLPSSDIDATRYGIIAENYTTLGKYELALEYLNKCIELLGSGAGYHVYMLRSEIYGHMNKLQERHNDLLKAMTIQPEKEDVDRDFQWHSHMYTQFHNLLNKQPTKENVERTLYHLDECLSLKPKESLLLYVARAHIHMTQANYDQAEKDLEKLGSLLSPDKNLDHFRIDVQRMFALAQLYLTQKRMKEAQTQIEQLLQEPYVSKLSNEQLEVLNKMKDIIT
jgi:tetratricopeptide (TPR) repeat protein